jgi:hypothetical protein
VAFVVSLSVIESRKSIHQREAAKTEGRQRAREAVTEIGLRAFMRHKISFAPHVAKCSYVARSQGLRPEPPICRLLTGSLNTFSRNQQKSRE